MSQGLKGQAMVRASTSNDFHYTLTANMSLIDMSDALPNLQRRQGLTTWKVFDRDMNEISSADKQKASSSGKGKPIAETCWPNGKEAEMHTERW